MENLVGTIATVGLFVVALLGGILAWVLSNERRITAIETAQKNFENTVAEIHKSISALHERLDSFFTGRERTPPRT